MTPKKIVFDALNFKNPARAPRQMWLLPWAYDNHRADVHRIWERFPDDIVQVSPEYSQKSAVTKGNPYEPGLYTDEWGCVFSNLQKGIVGEVKQPLICSDGWEDAHKVHIPEEWLSFDAAQVNLSLENEQRFTMPAICPRPFEQLQFIRGVENLYMDLLLKPAGMLAFIERMHDFYCRLLKKWAGTNVDSLMFMDDWGSQSALLISPKLWDEIFRPMYRDYIDIAHKAGKKAFMHSDGFTLDIIPRLIDIGLDAVNAQIFCIGPEKLKGFAGKITFWGEIDRQHLLVRGSPDEIRAAVISVYKNLWKEGGCIAQCEFTPGAKPENVYTVFEAWESILKN